jgi:hypothetical protein
MDKWDYMKLKSYAQQKKWSFWQRPPTEQEKIFPSCTSDKRLITRIYRELIDDPIKKWATELNRTFSKEKVQMAKKHMKKMLIIPSHKGNANQNHSKIPPHSC